MLLGAVGPVVFHRLVDAAGRRRDLAPDQRHIGFARQAFFELLADMEIEIRPLPVKQAQQLFLDRFATVLAEFETR